MKGKRIWWIGLTVAAGGIVYHFATTSDRCPIDLPSKYRLIAFVKASSSAEVALNLKLSVATPATAIGSSTDWLFESKGTVAESAWPLLMFLRKNGDWRQLKSRAFTVYSDDGISPKVVMIPIRHRDGTIDPSKHQVRINGPWRAAGPYEKLLASLPKKTLESWTKDHSSKPILFR